jgi:hypothetical protein
MGLPLMSVTSPFFVLMGAYDEDYKYISEEVYKVVCAEHGQSETF